MRRNFLIALTCCCCSFINLSAQELRGVVMDSKQHPIVMLLYKYLMRMTQAMLMGG